VFPVIRQLVSIAERNGMSGFASCFDLVDFVDYAEFRFSHGYFFRGIITTKASP
jgi:hypothetical protein